MRNSILLSISLFTGALSLQAQLPIRNFIFLSQDTIQLLLEAEGMQFDIYSDGNEDTYGYDYNWEDEEVYYEDYGEEEESVQDEELGAVPPEEEIVAVDTTWAAPSFTEEETDYYEDPPVAVEVTISVFSNDAFGYTNNDASFSLRNDTCYLIQYNWYSDQFVLESVRNVMDQREDFSPCFDMKDCWVQQKPGDETLYYWNLFEQYEGDEAWKVLRIEAEKEFEENRWWYQFSEGKF
ncbi:MAG: hypothetical protein IPL49_08115 [Saprospirales bacterium]|nr:hypothetical protein [Saprospirales bacterium]MBK8490847.1 hypothetical protein [Saprospirales bacterium]